MKKVLMLGSDICTEAMAEYIKEEGHYLIVSDFHPVEKSYVKKMADEHWEISSTDVDTLYNKCLEEHVDAVVAGIAEYNIGSAIDLCERLHLPFYADKKAWGIFNDKLVFKENCRKFQLPVAKEYTIDDIPAKDEFPIVVKPADSSLNNGLSICQTYEELEPACKWAYQCSPSHRIVVEQYIEGILLGFMYHMIDGQIELTYVSESYHNLDRKSCYYIFSCTSGKYTDIFLEKYDQKVREFLSAIGCRNGCLFIQAIGRGDEVVLLETNYRPDGSGVFNTIKKTIGIDVIRIITDISLYGKTNAEIVKFERNRITLCDYILWTYKTCVVKEIEGIDAVKKKIVNLDCVIACSRNQKIIANYDKGTMLLVFSFTAHSKEEYIQIVNLINSVVRVVDEDGYDILDKMDPSKVLTQ